MTSSLRFALPFVLLLAAAPSHAQLLLVNDNDNILANTDSVVDALSGTGVPFTVYDVAGEGAPPTYAQLDAADAIIWYCSGDGVDLGLWLAQEDLRDLAVMGKPIWFIGTDMLYAAYGAPPVTFDTEDFAFNTMGVASYDVQSYGDDGGLGCPQVDVATEVVGSFPATLHWAFPTFWWMDGCTPALDDVDVIYRMGGADYVLFGAPSMVHDHIDARNVMSTFFDPALIDTYAHRVEFFQQTMAYMATGTGIHAVAASPLRVRPDGAGGLFIESVLPLASASVFAANGMLERSMPAANASSIHVDMAGLSSGLHLVVADAADGTRMNAKWVVP